MSVHQFNQLDHFMEAGLLQEQWAWVDQLLAQRFHAYAITPDNVEEYAIAKLIERPILSRGHALLEAIPRDNEEQDTTLLARKYQWIKQANPELYEINHSGLPEKRSREDELEDHPFIKRFRNYIAIVSDDEEDYNEEEDRLYTAMELCAIGSDEEFSVHFANDDMSLESYSDNENEMEIDSQDW